MLNPTSSSTGFQQNVWQSRGAKHAVLHALTAARGTLAAPAAPCTLYDLNGVLYFQNITIYLVTHQLKRSIEEREKYSFLKKIFTGILLTNEQ